MPSEPRADTPPPDALAPLCPSGAPAPIERRSDVPPTPLDRAIDEVIAYLAEQAGLTPAEAFIAVESGYVLSLPAPPPPPRRLSTGLRALVRRVRRKDPKSDRD